MLVHQILRAKARGTDRDPVVTVKPEATVAEVAKLLSEKRIGAVIASPDGKRPVGIVSERDIVREVGRRGADALAMTVADIMTRKLVACGTDDVADQILTHMTDGRFRHMPVVDSDGMVGVISIGDVVKARLDELHMEKEALKGMIMGY